MGKELIREAPTVFSHSEQDGKDFLLLLLFLSQAQISLAPFRQFWWVLELPVSPWPPALSSSVNAALSNLSPIIDVLCSLHLARARQRGEGETQNPIQATL